MSNGNATESHFQEMKQAKEPRGEGQTRTNRVDRNQGNRNQGNHRQSFYRSDKDSYSSDRRSDKDSYSSDRSRDKRSNDRERFNQAPKYREPRYHSGTRKNHASKAKQTRKGESEVIQPENLQKLSLEPPQNNGETVIKEKAAVLQEPTSGNLLLSKESQSNHSQTTKSKPFHGHYHHKNSNKPRFSKIFSENGKDSKTAGGELVGNKESEVKTEPSVLITDRKIPDSNATSNSGDDPNDLHHVRDAPLIDQLKVISQELNNPKSEDVFAKLKSGEGVELENLKQLYDKIPDITKTEIIKETEEWATSAPSTETVLQESSKSSEISSEEIRSMPCCHGNCCPPYYPHGYMPPALPPHPAYYYAALWNYHHPVPPPPVQRIANAPSLPPPCDNAALHKRYITRSAKTPGSIVFTLHVSDNLRIVSVRSEDSFTMTADLCNEEGEKIAENFMLHAETSPKLWEQYAFSGNHTLHFNVTAPCTTVVVVTFLHEIPLR
ncbi:uncharacterized protein LOC134825245 [Bolinopsis microptera]|uniref:uncharacterized protein LOC134825245 n=1 Tax=Bolinopsis microptera TaxID=2820187 RepID=UPI0030799D7C